MSANGGNDFGPIKALYGDDRKESEKEKEKEKEKEHEKEKEKEKRECG